MNQLRKSYGCKCWVSPLAFLLSRCESRPTGIGLDELIGQDARPTGGAVLIHIALLLERRSF